MHLFLYMVETFDIENFLKWKETSLSLFLSRYHFNGKTELCKEDLIPKFEILSIEIFINGPLTEITLPSLFFHKTFGGHKKHDSAYLLKIFFFFSSTSYSCYRVDFNVPIRDGKVTDSRKYVGFSYFLKLCYVMKLCYVLK